MTTDLLIKMYPTTLNEPNCKPYKNQKGKYEFLNAVWTAREI